MVSISEPITDLTISLETIAYIIVVSFCYWLVKTFIYYGFIYNFKLYDFFKERYKNE